MVRETIVDTAYPIFIPLRVGYNQFCVPPYHSNVMEGNKCTDAGLTGADPMDADTTGGDTDEL